jgi:hypothetical protein
VVKYYRQITSENLNVWSSSVIFWRKTFKIAGDFGTSINFDEILLRRRKAMKKERRREGGREREIRETKR